MFAHDSRWTAALWWPIALAIGLALAGCKQDAGSPTANDASGASTGGAATRADSSPDATGGAAPATARRKAGDSSPLLVDVTAALGIVNPPGPYANGTFKTPEITPGGVALFDYNGDGRIDIYQVCHPAPGSFTAAAPNRLFAQQADGKFKEVPQAAGADDPGFGHGVAVGDIDNDGDFDLFVTNYGEDVLYRNDGGKFVNISRQARILTGHRWSSSTGFLDYDRDGDLDLYVARFAIFDPEKKCHASNDPTDLDYCGPHMFPGQLDTLYRNDGEGKFTDVTAEAGINKPGRGWGVTFGDFTGDGWIDIYVANDEEPAQLWVNQRNGKFREEAVIWNCAYNAAGRVEAGMGLAVGDINGDRLPDLFKTHIASETNTLYVRSKKMFMDVTSRAGMSAIDRPYTGWGTGFVDVDHDGDLDVAVANGRVSKAGVRPQAKLGPFWNRFAEPKLLFANDGKGVMSDISSQTGSYGVTPEVTRGLAFADLDGDGDLDLVACNLDNTLRVFRNDAPAEGTHWLLVRAKTGNRDAHGAAVTVTGGGKSWLRLCEPTYSFLASNDHRAHFGLGSVGKLDAVEVAWPDGKRERFPAPEGVDRAIVVEQGQGQAAD